MGSDAPIDFVEHVGENESSTVDYVWVTVKISLGGVQGPFVSGLPIGTHIDHVLAGHLDTVWTARYWPIWNRSHVLTRQRQPERG